MFVVGVSTEICTMTSREQIFAVFRDLKWIIAVSLVISVALYLPDQVRELYRISAADAGWTTVRQFVAVTVIALLIWGGALQIATETSQRMTLGTQANLVLRLVPVLAGTAPLLAAAFAQLVSRPDTRALTPAEIATLREVGSIFRIQENALEFDKTILWLCFAGYVIIAFLFVAFAWHASKTLRAISLKANERYFSRSRFLLATICLIAMATAIFVVVPDKPAQWLETFGVAALFTLCVVSFCVHISLLTIEHRFPFFPAIFAAGLIIAWLDLNDNHHIRALPTSSEKADLAPRRSLADVFPDWLEQRRSKSAEGEEFPVFVVTAQGGGLYAAHNTATFLARMQDLCPAFRSHLFAISSVSGGSIGATVFATALHASDLETERNEGNAVAATEQQCATIGQFLAGASRISNLDQAGSIETKVQLTLSADYLSPLVAASLFSDFTQTFVPIPIPAFDRARALEFTLENAADRMYVGTQGTKYNLLRMDYQAHWKPDNWLPALLLNSTDAGSGKRVVMSPFDFNAANLKDSDLCMLANLKRPEPNSDQRVQSFALSFPLSAAAFVSARFPWATPAATVAIDNDCITHHHEARLVDGGYIDNSGVETALSLIDEIDAIRRSRNLPKFRIYLISLTGGDFPDHGPFSFDELMEPIRALLSGRTSRTYIALNRAASRDAVRESLVPAKPEERTFRSYVRTDLKNYFYNLPLGWALSEKTRDIVFLNSGRFWDCDPDSSFSQTRKHLSNADCIQLQIHHLLNNSAKAAFEQQDIGQRVSLLLRQAKASESQRPQKVDHQRLLACYERKWFHERGRRDYSEALEKWRSAPQASSERPEFPAYREQYIAYYQSEHVRALLSEWDRLPGNDSRILAYLLGSISYDSWDFARTSENLSFSNTSQIPLVWQNKIQSVNAKRKEQREEPIQIESLLNNPRKLANVVWGSSGNIFGNNKEDDGWKFRPRGIYQMIGREQYRFINEAMPKLYPSLKLDFIEVPDAMWDRTVSAKVAWMHFYSKRYPTKSGQRRTLVELLEDKAYGWKDVRAIQVDTDHSDLDQERVAERSDMFTACINEALEAQAGVFRFRQWLGLTE
jgi:predicted chitinase